MQSSLPVPSLSASYKLWADQMASSTPSSPPQPNSVFGQGSYVSRRVSLNIRKKRDKRQSISSISSTLSPTRSVSVRHRPLPNGSSIKRNASLHSNATSTQASHNYTQTLSNVDVENSHNNVAHKTPKDAAFEVRDALLSSADSASKKTYGLNGNSANGNHTTHARAPSSSSFNFHNRSPSETFAPSTPPARSITPSMSSSSELDALEQLVQPDLSMPEKATASLDQLYSLLAERTVQLSHNSYQNSQLWNMVNKQRQMILDLQRDLDSTLDTNAKYKRRLLRHQQAQSLIAAQPQGLPSSQPQAQTPSDSLDDEPRSNTPSSTQTTATDEDSTRQFHKPTNAVSTSPAPASTPSSTATPLAAAAVVATPTTVVNGSSSANSTPTGTTSNGHGIIPKPIVPLPYPLPAISSARTESKSTPFSFEEGSSAPSSGHHRKSKSDTLHDDPAVTVPDKSPSRENPRLKHKKSMASVMSSSDGDTLTSTVTSTSMIKSASAGAPTLGSVPPPALAPEPVTLYVRPSELSTIRVDVASSLGVARKKDTPVVVLSVSDRATCKELWRISKEYNAFVQLDSQVGPQISSFKTKIPDRSLFTSHAPARVDIRKDQLNAWFASLLATPRIPNQAAQTLCEFLSTNTMDPLDVPDGDARKEGFLTKRGKSFGGWKLRYFVLDGPLLNYYESPNGPHLGAIRLYNARIGRQTQEEDSNSEDAYRHAFLVMEPRKKDYVRHVLCAENDRERDDWIEALLEFVTLPEPDSPIKSVHSPATAVYGESIYDEYSEAPTPTLPTTEAIDSVMDSSASSNSTKATTGLGITDLDPPSPQVRISAPISAPIASEPIQNLQKWGYKYSPSSQSLNAQLYDDDHPPPAPEEQKKKKFFLFRKGNSDKQAQQQQHSTPEYLQSVLEAEGMIMRDERPTTPSLSTPTQSQFDSNDYHNGVFGAPLLQAIEKSSKDIDGHIVPSVVWRCIAYLDEQKAHYEEGIFRLSGSASAIRTLKARFNDNYDIDLITDTATVFDVHAAAGLLKLFLREMPDLILTQQLSPAFRRAMEISDIVAKIYELKQLVKQLPRESHDLLFILAQYLCKIIEHQDYNKMNLRNVGIVFSPTVNVPAGIFVLFLTDFDCIFGDATPRTDINRKLQDFPQALLLG